LSDARRWRWPLLLLCTLAGGALNLYRQVWWHPGGPPRTSGFCAPAELRAADLNRFTPGYCRIEIPETPWRPLDVTIQLRAPSPLPATAAVVGDAGRRVHITADQPPITDPLLAYVVAAPEVGRIDTLPHLASTAVAAPILTGALLGLATALLLTPFPASSRRRERDRDPENRPTAPNAAPEPAAAPEPTAAPEPRVAIEPANAATANRLPARAGRGFFMRPLGMFVLLFLYFTIWALVRPPFQTPDEVQHQMRTTSILREPWVAKPGMWTFDPRFANPLAYWAPPMLDKLFFNPSQRLSRGEVTALKQVGWPDASMRPPAEPYARAIASYPTLYYLTLFALAEPLVQVAHLTPYDSSYAYRLISSALAALCWTLVLLQLTRQPAMRESGMAIGALLVLNPMTAFMSSAVNVDAVNIPLAILASLLFWRLLTTGAGQWSTLAALVLTCWTKPSGLQLIGALLVATLALWAVASRLRLRLSVRVSPRLSEPLALMPGLKLALLTLARAAIIAWITFYAWSPPRFLGGQPAYDTLTTYLAARWGGAFSVWITYWGKLGWLEYSVAPIWYVLVLIALLAGIACAAWRPRGSRAFMLFTAILLIAFVAATLTGEFLYLPVSGYVLQGRHLLPASIGLALVVMHRVTAARIALLALLVLLNVLLIQATIDRYYNGQWKVAAHALPFSAAR